MKLVAIVSSLCVAVFFAVFFSLSFIDSNDQKKGFSSFISDIFQANNDLAIEYCRNELISGLRSPSTYKEISNSILQNYATIEYDAQNAFGAMLRDKHYCPFFYYDGNFYVDLPDTRSDEDRLNNLLRWISAKPIPAESTDIQVSFSLASAAMCLSAAAAENSLMLMSKINTGDFSVEEANTDHSITIKLYSLERSEDDKLLPARFTCTTKDEAGIYSIVEARNF